MQRLYSQSTGATYFEKIHTSIPGDALPITEARYQEVIANPAPNKFRDHDASGLPILVEPSADSADGLTVLERVWRDAQLSELIWLRDRHRDQQELSVATTLSADQYTQLLIYLQQLRDWPQAPEFPDTTARPQAPTFLEQQGNTP